MLNHNIRRATGALRRQLAGLHDHIAHDRHRARGAAHQLPARRAGVDHREIAVNGVAIQSQIAIRNQPRRVEREMVVILPAIFRRRGGDAGEQCGRAFLPDSQRHAAAVAGMLINCAVGECQRILRHNGTTIDQSSIDDKRPDDCHGARVGNFEMNPAAGIGHVLEFHLLRVVFRKHEFCISRRGIGVLRCGAVHREIAPAQIPRRRPRTIAL